MQTKLMMQLQSLERWIVRRLRREEGQGLVEYALIIALVAIALVVALTGLKDGITNTFTSITSNLAS